MTARRWWLTTSSTRWICSPTRRAHRRRCRCSSGCSTRVAQPPSTTTTVKFTARGGQRQLPVPRLAGQLQRHHHQGGQRPQGLREDVPGHRPVQARQVHPQGGRLVRPQRRLLGHQGQPGPHRVHVLRRRRPADPRPPGQAGRRRRPDLRLRRPRRSSTTPATSSSTSPRPRTARCTCATTRRRSPTSACARRSRSALDRPSIISSLFEGKAKVGNDSPFASVYPVDRPLRAAADAGRRPGEAAALGRRALEPTSRAR